MSTVDDPDRRMVRQRTRALAELSELRTMLGRLPRDDPGYRELAVRKEVAAAEALNLGIAEVTVRRIGLFDDLEMRRVCGEAAEFRRYDADLAQEY
ncbi:hypothetical protein [Nocardia wallacei]|uniref:hypothetical protein n=1 Tax=Nocardia wallacei TaxID=480035 RepID=UPI002454A16C|nr:hypothetical protein [Nocardia wallacei]